ncbi:hypothetical protein [Psychroserpens ponticola]|uniref:DUF4252 domain-containing protein n=1 Tax=Psychroserpens ponticola TaxID=2932268 RepID=A0ABY7RU93_9FLAO|nr:hypothetical protein [Psychroserpens ponticola]WCO00245.1 hypothetical protein MUN68_009175 [Psychroserpens ponticola]
MKKIIICIILISIAENTFSQQLDFPFLNKLTKISIDEVDDYMINYYGYEKIESKSETNVMTYGRYYNHDLDNSIMISISFKDDKPNTLELLIAKNFDIQTIKKELIKRGYKKQSLIDFKFVTFKKEKSTVLVSIIPNEFGKSKIRFISES